MEKWPTALPVRRKRHTRNPESILFSVISIVLLLPVALSGQAIDYKDFSKRTDRLFSEQITQAAPGAAVVVTEGGKTIFERCYGLADVEHDVPVTSTTLFNLASVAKQFTAFAVLLLEREGKIGLDDDIHKYIPDLPDYPRVVTIRNLLNHTSGIWECYSTMVYYCGYDLDDHFTLDEDLELLKRQKELLFEPGSQWSYCNTNYMLLAQVVEKVTGLTFQEWTTKNIFQPLGMEDSFFMKNSSQIVRGKAEPYKRVKGELVKDAGPWTNAVGMGYLFTNVEDMVLWMDNFRTMKVGGKDVVDKMFQKTKLNDGSESFYGFGLGVSTRADKQVIGHSGQTAGYKTAMLYCPELELGIAVLANERSIDSEGLANRIFDLYVGTDTGAPAASNEGHESVPFDAESASRYAGGYVVDGMNATVAVNVEDGYLHCAFFGLGEDFFYPTGEKSFANRSGDNTVEFAENEDGVVDKANLTVHGEPMAAGRIVLDRSKMEARLADYSGSYYSEAFGTVYNFRVKDGQTFMHQRRYGEMRLQPIDAEEFFCILGFVKLNRNQDGAITGFTLTPSDEKFCFQPIEFVKVR